MMARMSLNKKMFPEPIGYSAPAGRRPWSWRTPIPNCMHAVLGSAGRASATPTDRPPSEMPAASAAAMTFFMPCPFLSTPPHGDRRSWTLAVTRLALDAGGVEISVGLTLMRLHDPAVGGAVRGRRSGRFLELLFHQCSTAHVSTPGCGAATASGEISRVVIALTRPFRV